MTAKHTPGPWTFKLQHLGDYRIADKSNRIVAETRAFGDVHSAGNEEEDARLIAAAPDLLAALEEMVNNMLKMASFGFSEEEVATFRRAEAAIAKAKGDSP